jgi:hypothetical protein
LSIDPSSLLECLLQTCSNFFLFEDSDAFYLAVVISVADNDLRDSYSFIGLKQIPLMVSDNKARSEVDITIHTRASYDEKPLMKY